MITIGRPVFPLHELAGTTQRSSRAGSRPRVSVYSAVPKLEQTAEIEIAHGSMSLPPAKTTFHNHAQ
jgi:hypothetical protein